MNKYLIFVFSLLVSVSSLLADIDCPADSSYHVDMRTMLPDGSPNPSYGQQISTGLCACVTFEDGIEVNGNEVTFTINIVDNEPIRGIELDIHHDFAELTYESVSRGEKLQGLVNDEGNHFTNHYCASVGEGTILVSNINGNILNGDYITTSILPGYGRNQNEDILRSYTVAKCTETVDWDSLSSDIIYNNVEYKTCKVACTYHCG